MFDEIQNRIDLIASITGQHVQHVGVGRAVRLDHLEERFNIMNDGSDGVQALQSS